MNQTTKDILKEAGYPMPVLVLDFETYFDKDYSLKKMSIMEYIQDKRFDFTGLGVQVPSGKTLFAEKFGVRQLILDLEQLYGNQFRNVTVVVKNARFDIQILKEICYIVPPYIIDIEDLSRFYDSRMRHDLKTLAKTFKLPAKGDTMQFKGLHYEDMSAEQKKALREYCLGDVDLESQLFELLLPYMSNPKFELWLARHTLDLTLNPVVDFDFALAKQLKEEMQTELDVCLNKVQWIEQPKKSVLKVLNTKILFPQILQKELPVGEKLPLKKGKPTKKMIELWGPGLIPALAKADEAFQALLVHPNQRVRELCEAKAAAKSWPAHIKKITTMETSALCHAGLLPIGLKYYGGHTGRWSGTGGWNPQNLGGRGRAGKANHPLISKVRGLLRAPKGCVFGIVDSAQIEARVLAWLAGETKLIEGFARGEDIYSNFGTELFGHLIYKAAADDPGPVQEILKVKRGFAKDGILGCGYGMGPIKFYANCRANESLRPLFDSGEYDFEFIKKLIYTYRDTYSKIPELWRLVERSFKRAVKYPDLHSLTNTPNWLKFEKRDLVYIQLPSGRELIYRHCRIKRTTRGSELRWGDTHIWGGALVENIVQAIARDLLAYWIYITEQAGIQVVLSSHDEIVTVLPERDAELQLQQMINIMCVGPEWADGLPLGAEAELSDVYKK